MFYSIRHVTRFRYCGPVSESMMEARMHPRSDGNQRCLAFQLSVSPRARVMQYRDYLANSIHYFDVPGQHTQLIIVAEALVDVQPSIPIPYSLPQSSWDDLDEAVAKGDFHEMLMPSQFSKPTPSLLDLAEKLNVKRRDDPLRTLREINAGIYHWFDYVPQSTKVDSPIDDAIRAQRGVCQDFAHIMIALARELRIPCRYVSGYLFHVGKEHERSVEGATHAWVEAFLPELGWVGFDPTNNTVADDQHVRTAIGRDYADVPPTKGIYKGNVESELGVSVFVTPSDSLPPLDDEISMADEWSTFRVAEHELEQVQQQQQQQQ
jgi:transglutaminase-like putative cysteine protease